MKMKKLLIGTMTLVSTLGLVACGSSSSENSLETIKEKGKIVVAMNPEFAPFEFKTLVNGEDTIVGSDVELAKAIAEKIGVEVEFSTMSFDNVLASLQSGKADIAISGISATAERMEVYDFSASYYTAVNKVIIKKSDADKFASTKDLAKQSVAAQKGTIQETVVKEQIADASLVSLTKNGEMINELKSDQVQAVVLEEPIAKGYVAKNEDLILADIELDSSDGDAYAVAMPKGSDELKAVIDEVVQELNESGQMETFIQEAYDLSIGK